MGNVMERIVGPVDVANGTTTIFTGTTAHTYTIRTMCLVNNTAGSITISLGVNGTANANLVLPATPILAGCRMEWGGFLILAGTETIQAITTANGLTLTASGLDQS
jgi:hypothetical protein